MGLILSGPWQKVKLPRSLVEVVYFFQDELTQTGFAQVSFAFKGESDFFGSSDFLVQVPHACEEGVIQTFVNRHSEVGVERQHFAQQVNRLRTGIGVFVMKT